MWKLIFSLFKKWFTYPKAVYPLPLLDDREPKITSRGHWGNKSRPTHDGDDWCYPRMPYDSEPRGDGYGSSNGKWNVPNGSVCVAIRDGTVHETSFGKISTGLRLWVDHDDGYRSGYFHLDLIFVQPGDKVLAGQPLGLVGDNPKVTDLRHLHFEISPVDKYAPVDPWKYLNKHGAKAYKARK